MILKDWLLKSSKWCANISIENVTDKDTEKDTKKEAGDYLSN
jgi:hypothetical protein